MSLSVIILAAGKGTRMKSELPKVLHKIANKPLLAHVYDAAKKLGAEEIAIVYGHGGIAVKNACDDFEALWIEQTEQLGTGHAVKQAINEIKQDNTVLVLYGDVPLTTTDTLKQLLSADRDEIGLLTVELENPFGYGRIIRNAENLVTGIIEQKDATEQQQQIKEVNSGILCCKASLLNRLLQNINNNNSQGEYYLTDIFELAASQGITIATTICENSFEVEGVNNRNQLAALERIYQQRMAYKLMEQGVTIIDPTRIDIRGEVNIENDVTLDINVILEGNVNIGKGTVISSNSIIKNSDIGENVTILENCVIENSTIEHSCNIGPFARIRPDTVMKANAKIGNFVEVKKSVIGEGSKVNHLSYIGDTEMGADVNIGAGTITCNYDGAYKHKTTIGDKVFIGSDTQLVAPVTVREGVTIGAGTTVTKDVEAEVLVISRAPQKTIKGWQRPKKDK